MSKQMAITDPDRERSSQPQVGVARLNIKGGENADIEGAMGTVAITCTTGVANDTSIHPGAAYARSKLIREEMTLQDQRENAKKDYLLHERAEHVSELQQWRANGVAQARERLSAAKQQHRERVARRREGAEAERQAQFTARQVSKSASKRGYKLSDSNDRASAQVLLLGGAVEADLMASHALPKAGAVMQRVYVQAVSRAPLDQPSAWAGWHGDVACGTQDRVSRDATGRP